MKFKLLALSIIGILSFGSFVSAQVVSQDLCTGNIRVDRQAAQDCVTKAQNQATAKGYTATCVVQDVMLGFTDPNTSLNYTINLPCTINGTSGFSAELLAGWNSPSGVINPGWDTLARDLAARSSADLSRNAFDPLAPIRNTYSLIKKYDPCTHQFFGSYPATPNSYSPISSVAEVRTLLASTDGRAAAVPTWIANIVRNAPSQSPVYAQAVTIGRGGYVLNNYIPTSLAVDVSAANVPSQLLTANYAPNCSVVFSALGIQTPGVPPTTVTTNPNTPTNTNTNTNTNISNPVSLPVSVGTGSINIPGRVTTNYSGSASSQTLSNVISDLRNLVTSYRAQLQNINTIQPGTYTSSITPTIPLSSGLGSNFTVTDVCKQLGRDLKEGDLGTDVVTLTEFLVKEGLLSSTKSTFDAEVKQAVVLLQERYLSEILEPAGLSGGTGYVGSLTKRFINSKLCPTTTDTPISRINTDYTNSYFNNTSNTTNGLGPIFTTNVKASMKVGDSWYVVITGLNPGETAYLVGGKKVNGVYPTDRTPFVANSFGTIILTGTHGQDVVGEWQMTWVRSNLATIATYNFVVQ